MDIPSSIQEMARRLAETVAENNGEPLSTLLSGSLESIGTARPELDHLTKAYSGPESENANAPEESDDGSSDEPDEPSEFIEAERLTSILESLLFSTDKPVSIAIMKQIFKGSNIRTKDIERALGELASGYAAGDRGVTLEEIHGGYQIRTKVDNSEYLKRLAKVRPFRLSGPALEVLSILAYKQPITKHEIDEIRGVESGHLVRALMERGLVGFGEKSDLPGKPMTYLTTRKFLEIFGLRNLKELPTLAEIDQLLPEGIGDEEDQESLSDLTSSMSTEIKSTYSEGEDELTDISASLKVIETTSEFFAQEKIRQREERDRDRAQDIRERLTVGEMVDEKDQRWLARYETKSTAGAEAFSASDDPGVADDLAALSSETESVSSGIESIAEGEAEESHDELTARQDYDDDDLTDESLEHRDDEPKDLV